MSVYAIIPARGGSERLPGKNLRKVGGKSLVRIAIEQARAVDLVDGVCVSTDSQAIMAEAKACGTGYCPRPRWISGSHAQSESALLHALDFLRAVDDDVCVMLQPTNPIRRSEDIRLAISLLNDPKVNSVFAVEELCSYVWERFEGEPCLAAVRSPFPRQRTQDMEPLYIENGAIYVVRVGALRRTQNRQAKPTEMIVVAPGVDIDTEEDLRRAEALLCTKGVA